MKNYILPLLILAFVSLSTSACKRSGQSTSHDAEAYEGAPVKNDWIVSWLQANPQTLNPVISTDAYSRYVFTHVFDTLIGFDVQTGEPVGQLAESWTISEDGLTYDFRIRPGVQFHDGKPLTAEDIKFSFDRIKDPKVDAAHLQNYFKNFKSTEIVSPTHVRFHLSEAYYRNLIMLGLVEIMPKHIYGVGDFNTHPNNRQPIGSGPYTFGKWETGRSIELNRNPNWWGYKVDYWKDRNNFEKILFRVITEDSVAGLALKKGEIDILEPTPQQYVKDFVGKDFEEKFYRLKYSTEDGNGYRYIGWNLRRAQFQSKQVRQALAMALPREELNQKMYDGLLTLSVGPFPQGSSKLDSSVKPFPYDLEKAKSLLEEDGWKDTTGNGILDKNGREFQFELLFTAQSPEVERIALVYQQSLKQLGIQMNLKTLEWTVFLKQLMDDNFDSVLMAWGSSLDSDPYQIWHSSQASKGGSNRIHYKNARVDEILEEARKTLDREQRNELYREFSRIVADEAPYLFIFERPSLAVVTKRFSNVLPIGKLGFDSSAFFTAPGNEKYKSQ